MRTWLIYENGSLNPHIGRVGIFWDIATVIPGTMPVLWAAIEKCRFGWHHPACIDWEPAFLLRDSHGNQRQLIPGVSNPDTGTRIDGPYGYGLNAEILLTQDAPRPDVSFIIYRNHRPIAEIQLISAGAWPLAMPDRLMFQIECPVKLHSRIIEPGGTAFGLNGLRSLRVALRGGSPGAGSTPLNLVSYRAEPI